MAKNIIDKKVFITNIFAASIVVSMLQFLQTKKQKYSNIYNQPNIPIVAILIFIIKKPKMAKNILVKKIFITSIVTFIL